MSEETRKRGDALERAHDDSSKPNTVLATGEAPAASPEKDWRLAEGAAPRREGDDLSPEEAIRLIRGHEPADSPEPVAWQFRMSRRGHDEPPRWHTCTRKTFEERRDQGLTTRALYAEPTPKPPNPNDCRDCGAPHWYNFMVPDDVWKKIAPDQPCLPEEGGMLCAQCIDKRCAALGIEAEGKFYFKGEAVVSRYPDEPAGGEDG